MKKYFLLLSFVMIAFLASSFAVEDPSISQKVQQSFKRGFPNAGFVEWYKDQNYFKAIFV
ncbi:MAG: hypothetical protein JST17_06775 [Bacteroidetes bacterium]|nr:hypothetical protein [Bacteroidota bacterium]MBS1929738.1 hypothetical protein [Bacteroidota bacterium]